MYAFQKIDANVKVKSKEISLNFIDSEDSFFYQVNSLQTAEKIYIDHNDGKTFLWYKFDQENNYELLELTEAIKNLKFKGPICPCIFRGFFHSKIIFVSHDYTLILKIKNAILNEKIAYIHGKDGKADSIVITI